MSTRAHVRLRRRVTALLTTLAVVAVLVTAQGTATTEASWQDSEYSGAALTAGLAPPTANQCNYQLRNITLTWRPATRPAAVPINYSYRVRFGATTLVDWTVPSSATQLTYTIPLLGTGAYTFDVRAVAGTRTSIILQGRAVVVLAPVIGSCTWPFQ